MTDLHRCTVCHFEHRHPKASRATRAMALRAAFIVLEVLAALTLTGFLSYAMWALVAYNVLGGLLTIHGLATLATRQDHR